MIRLREVRPTARSHVSRERDKSRGFGILGLMAARLFCEDGEMMDPSVSVPIDAKARPIDDATPDPDELPLGSCRGEYAPSTCPPRADQPLLLLVDLKLAH
jgi:hypothetical protein